MPNKKLTLISREILADLETPLSIYFKLAIRPYSYLFESVQGGEKWGRYSIIGLTCQKIIRISDKIITMEENGTIIDTFDTHDPLAWIQEFQNQFQVEDNSYLPVFTGGLVGYLAMTQFVISKII